MFPTNTSLADAQIDLTDSFTQYFATGRATATNPVVTLIRSVGNGSHSIYGDSFSAKAIDLSSMIMSVDTSVAGEDCSIKIPFFYPYSQAGVISHWDGSNNFILGIKHSTAARLYKCVAGTYTQLLSVSAPYELGLSAKVEVKRLASNIFQLWYNGNQLGSNQTINDAGIINNTKYGVFTSLAFNKFESFKVGNKLVPFNL